MKKTFDRRDFLKASGAVAASTAAAATLPGCATQPAAPAKPIGRVVVIGAGYGGATCAKYLRMWSGGTIEVFLIDRSPQFISCPISNLVLGGTKTMADITRSYQGLREHGVQVLIDEVSGLDTQKKIIKFKAKYADMSYDRLVVSPGVDFMFDQIPALMNADNQKKILHAWKAGPDTIALR